MNPVEQLKNMRCGTCKYWSDVTSYVLPSVRMCDKAKMLFDSTYWSDETDEEGYPTRKTKEQCKDLMMFVQDGSDYYAALYTKEDFYCAHWKDLSE